MAQKKIFPFFLLLAFCSLLKASENITPELLAGTWKITDVKIASTENKKPLPEKDKCYLCDLYKAGLGLVFKTDGKVDYSNYGNPNTVQYTITDNVLTFYKATNAGNEGKEKTETTAQFIASLNNGVLTLVFTSGTTTETYTFTK